jgi:hypothetical protein
MGGAGGGGVIVMQRRRRVPISSGEVIAAPSGVNVGEKVLRMGGVVAEKHLEHEC